MSTALCEYWLACSGHGDVGHGGGFHLLFHIHVAAVGPLYPAVVDDLLRAREMVKIISWEIDAKCAILIAEEAPSEGQKCP